MIGKTSHVKQPRAVHLIDAENLCGSPLLTASAVRDLRRTYTDRVPVGPMDQIILASAHISVLALQAGWPGQRYVMRSGPNGADIRLAEIVAEEQLQRRFQHVYFGSGDGGLAPFAGFLEGNGVPVTAVSRIESISPRMRLATSEVIYLNHPAVALMRAA